MNKAVCKLLILISTSVVVFLVFNSDCCSYKRNGSHGYLKNASKDNVYERLMYLSVNEPSPKFEHLMLELLDTNYADMLVQGAAVRYVNEHNLIYYLAPLTVLKKHYDKVDQDSVWLIKIGQNKFRENKLKNSALMANLEETISLLSKINSEHKNPVSKPAF